MGADSDFGSGYETILLNKFHSTCHDRMGWKGANS